MNTTNDHLTLTRETIARLERLAASPEAARALAEAEAERTRKRTEVLRRLTDERSTSQREIAAIVPDVRKARDEVTRLQAELRGAQLSLANVEYRELIASLALERIAGTAEAALASLGGEAIDRSLRLVLFAQRQARGDMEWRHIVSPYGYVTAVVPVSDAPAVRLERLRELQAELEAMRLDPMAPADIERRCTEIEEAIERPEAPRPAQRAQRAGLFHWAGWSRKQ